MKIKFNKFERVAGLFVLVAFLGAIVVGMGVAIKKGWFSTKIVLATTLENAEGIHAGTTVQVAGLRAGEVTDVELLSAKEVRVEFKVLEKFHKRIKEDSVVQVVRPFIIGEKVLDVSVGGEGEKKVKARAHIPSKPGMDIMDLISGRKLAPLLGTLEGLMENMKLLAEAFSDPERTKSMIKMFDRMEPMIVNLNKMSIEMVKVTDIATKKKRLDIVMENLALMSKELGIMLPELSKSTPDIAKQIPQLVSNLTELSGEFKKLTPTINAIAPKLPRASERAIEALDEVVVTLKAMQKSWMMRGNVKAVREQENKRKPANK